MRSLSFDLPLGFELWALQLPPHVALAIVAALGFLVGRRSRSQRIEQELDHAQRELRRALVVAAELEKIAAGVRESLSRHQSDLQRFRTHVAQLSGNEPQNAWKELCDQAEKILLPTLELSNQMAGAYELLRQQSANLMSFSESRTDPLTRVYNRRALDESLAAQCSMARRYGTHFSLALFDIDHFKAVNDQHGHLEGDRILQAVASLLAESVRGGDSVARFGGEEFLVILPQTDLTGAGVFGDRMRQQIAQRITVTSSVGVAQAGRDESPEQVLARADQALYAAKAAGRNRVYRHTDGQVEPLPTSPAESSEAEPPQRIATGAPVLLLPITASALEAAPPSANN